VASHVTEQVSIWVCAHPLLSVGGVASVVAVAAFWMIPRLHNVTGDGHPRV
jgi:hypothetical protein